MCPLINNQKSSYLCVSFTLMDIYRTALYKFINESTNLEKEMLNKLKIIFNVKEIYEEPFKTENKHLIDDCSDIIKKFHFDEFRNIFVMVVSPRSLECFIRNPCGSKKNVLKKQYDFVGMCFLIAFELT